MARLGIGLVSINLFHVLVFWIPGLVNLQNNTQGGLITSWPVIAAFASYIAANSHVYCRDMGDPLVSVAAKLKPAAKGAPSIDGVLAMASRKLDVILLNTRMPGSSYICYFLHFLSF